MQGQHLQDEDITPLRFTSLNLVTLCNFFSLPGTHGTFHMTSQRNADGAVVAICVI